MEDLFRFVRSTYRCWEYQQFSDINGKPAPDKEGDYYVSDYDRKFGIWKQLKTYDDEETFIKNYGNPSFSIHHNRVSIIVTKDDSKVSIKLFWYYRERKKGKTYFKVTKDFEFLTFNYKNNTIINNSGGSLTLIRIS